MKKEISGRIWQYGDNIDTDVIYPSKYLVSFDPEEAAKHAMEGIESGFANKIKNGDFVIGGRNFGCGSAREQAPLALKFAGVGAVLAESFSRTFFRNAINIGLPVLSVPGITKLTNDGDEMTVDLKKGLVHNITTKKKLQAKPLPGIIFDILNSGGAIPYYRKKLLENIPDMSKH